MIACNPIPRWKLIKVFKEIMQITSPPYLVSLKFNEIEISSFSVLIIQPSASYKHFLNNCGQVVEKWRENRKR